MDDLDDHLAGGDRLQHLDANRAGADAIGEFLSELDVERTEGVIRNGSLTLNGNIREPYLLGNISAEDRTADPPRATIMRVPPGGGW
ncbi:MAG: hypothetical protein HUU29_07985 [Planctomycetaceae bacterium]|nr:hypothetical protein [Planctomycetaceae bacterium]